MTGSTGLGFTGKPGEGLTVGPVPVHLEAMARCTLSVSDPGYERNIHTDPEVARRYGFEQPIAEARLWTTLLSGLLGGALGPAWLSGGTLAIAFLKPVLPGDQITAHAVVTARKPEPDGKRLDFEVWCVNQREEKVATGTASCLV